MAGVNRLLSMQTPSGGFGVWPGASDPVPWGTAYVVDTLFNAQKLGYAVPQGRLDEALAYLEREAAGSENGTASYDSKYGLPPDAWEPYVQYVLSLAGRGRPARVQRLVETFPKEPRGAQLERLYLLQAALYLAGDRRYEAALRKPDVSALSAERSWGWDYYSDLRRRGLLLSVFIDLFDSDPAGTGLADLVADGLRAGRGESFSTQELAWGVSGLGKWIGHVSRDFTPPVLLANSKPVAPGPAPAGGGSGERSWSLARASECSSLVLRLAPDDAQPPFLILSSEGVRESAAVTVGGEGLQVERRYRGLDGEAVDLSGTGVKLGDLVMVELSLTNQRSEQVTNIALVDRFPAGLEVENPRLGRGIGPSWLPYRELWELDYLDLRDDRVQVFGGLGPGERRIVVYTLRAVTAGLFALPPVEATAMYDPRVWARAAGGRAEVLGPWSDAER